MPIITAAFFVFCFGGLVAGAYEWNTRHDFSCYEIGTGHFDRVPCDGPIPPEPDKSNWTQCELDYPESCGDDVECPPPCPTPNNI